MSPCRLWSLRRERNQVIYVNLKTRAQFVLIRSWVTSVQPSKQEPSRTVIPPFPSSLWDSKFQVRVKFFKGLGLCCHNKLFVSCPWQDIFCYKGARYSVRPLTKHPLEFENCCQTWARPRRLNRTGWQFHTRIFVFKVQSSNLAANVLSMYLQIHECFYGQLKRC